MKFDPIKELLDKTWAAYLAAREAGDDEAADRLADEYTQLDMMTTLLAM